MGIREMRDTAHEHGFDMEAKPNGYYHFTKGDLVITFDRHGSGSISVFLAGRFTAPSNGKPSQRREWHLRAPRVMENGQWVSPSMRTREEFTDLILRYFERDTVVRLLKEEADRDIADKEKLVGEARTRLLDLECHLQAQARAAAKAAEVRS